MRDRWTVMTIEHARRRPVNRPWGVNDPGEWGAADGIGDRSEPVGEIWYDRAGNASGQPALLLKVLLTNAPLSIQVHPDDAHAHAIGLPNGKSEAWHVLSAAEGAEVALGLKQHMTSGELRNAALDGSISEAMAWRAVAADDTIMVPAGTIHALGAGLIVAEIQQRSDTTFRLFDHGSARELHIDRAVAVAIADVAASQPEPHRMSAQRTLLAAGSHFVLERLELPPNSTWQLAAERETWLLVLQGRASAGGLDIVKADAVFAEHDEVSISAGNGGLVALVAYTGSGPIPGMLTRGTRLPTRATSNRSVMSTISAPGRGRIMATVPAHGRAPSRTLERVAFIGNHLPRRCGIATFTHDLHHAVAELQPALDTCVVAMNDAGRSYDYPGSVEIEIADASIESYVDAAETLNRGGFDVVSLQHEYGIFGGADGSHVLELIRRLEMPIVTTLHTVLAAPSPGQRAVMSEIIARSARLIVMAEKGRELLQTVHGVRSGKIEVIPHGIPDVPYRGTSEAKRRRGFSGRSVILTFGLLSPSKGIETMIEAMPRIVEACSNAVYVVLGASHPHLVRDQGEAYRERLQARVSELALDDHVVFIDQFVDQATLLDFIAMCDVYVTPYLNEAQMTSGTLAYSFGLGKAVVSTPYWHASELLADGRGILVPFDDASSITHAITGLLTDDRRRDAMRERAYADSRSMTWERTAATYLTAFERARKRTHAVPVTSVRRLGAPPTTMALPEMQISHFLSMCDSTGLLQHAVHCVPDRSHGYCVDDNARALLLAVSLGGPGEPRLSNTVTTRFAAFIQHAWNPDTRRFRNFMSYDRRWLEPQGSEDSHGRTLWALGACARSDHDPSRRRWAAALFTMALPSVERFTSPRAWAFALLGIDAYCALHPDDPACERMRGVLAEKLLVALTEVETPGWVWFEEGLSYDNARLPQALIQTGVALANDRLIDAGIRSLRWLMEKQSAPDGTFRPVGTDSFGHTRRDPLAFDQQPVEAAATIAACIAAWNVTRRPEWVDGAISAHAWFLGHNDLAEPLADLETGGCRDGLHPDRANENRGAESVLSYLFAVVDVRRFFRGAAFEHDRISFNLARGGQVLTTEPGFIPGGNGVSSDVPKPTSAASAS